jgi:SAM-dependent methyltransferase
MVEQSGWIEITKANPDHSAWYIERFRAMRAAGDDLAGEARFIDALAPRGALILDAGCGPGRVGSALAALGHQVVGVDVDPELIDAAIHDHPGPLWLVGDLAEFDLPDGLHEEGFDVVLCVGNVMTFLAPSTRQAVLANLRRTVRPGGRVVIGFGSGRGYEFEEFLTDAASVGLQLELRFATWDVRPFTPADDFLVATFV